MGRIDEVNAAIADLDRKIGAIQARLDSPDTPADLVNPLNAALDELQAKRSALGSTLIDLRVVAGGD